MAISSAGIGSGLDVNTIVEQMGQLNRRPLQQLQVRQQSMQTQISAFGQIKSLASKLSDIMGKMSRDSGWNGVSISSSHKGITGTMTGIATPGTHTLKVTQLAQSQTTVFAPKINQSETMRADGKLTLKVHNGSLKDELDAFNNKTGNKVPDYENVEIEIKSGDKLTDVASKINKAALSNGKNAGMQATVITHADGTQQLMLRSKATGEVNKFEATFAVTNDITGNGTSNLGKFGSTPYTENSAETTQKAIDAKAVLNGMDVKSSSNTFDVMPGMTFTATETTKSSTPSNPGNPSDPANFDEATLEVKADTEGMKKNIQEFVEVWNELYNLLSESTKYEKVTNSDTGETEKTKDANGKEIDKVKVGVLQGDSFAVSVRNKMISLLQGTSGTSGAFRRLTDIGLDFNKSDSGVLALDENKLNNALKDPDAVMELFKFDGNEARGQGNGIADNFKAFTDDLLNWSTGSLTLKVDNLNKRLEANEEEQLKVDERAQKAEERLLKQYQSLDVKMAGLNSLSSYVSQMVSSWNKS